MRVGGPECGGGQTGVSQSPPGKESWSPWTEGSLQPRLPAPLLTRPWPPDGWGGPRSPAPRSAGEGREEGKARPLTLLPARPTSAISSILGTWLDQYSEDFCQPPDFPCLRQLVAYVQLNMPGSDLERRAHLLLAQLEHADLSEAEPEGEEGGVGAGLGGRPHIRSRG